MRTLSCFLLAVGIALGQGRGGDFNIRFDPTAALQASVAIPFAIHVTDARHMNLLNAKVTLQIETLQHTDVTVFNAAGTDPGVYVAKPIFPSAGEWSVYVEVRQGDRVSARTIEYNVPETISP